MGAERIVVDPGFGFGKTAAQNLELMRRLRELRGLGRPVLVGPSRKSTIGAILGGLPPPRARRGDAGAADARGRRPAPAWCACTTSPRRCARCKVADAVVRGTPPEIAALPAPGPTG